MKLIVLLLVSTALALSVGLATFQIQNGHPAWFSMAAAAFALPIAMSTAMTKE